MCRRATLQLRRRVRITRLRVITGAFSLLVALLATRAANAEPVRSIATANGKVYVVTSHEVRVYDANLKETGHVTTPDGVEAYGLAVSPDHRTIAVSRSDGNVWLLAADSLKERRTMRVRGTIVHLPTESYESEDPFGEVRGVGYATNGKLVTISERGALCFEDKAICYDAMPSPTGVIPAGRVASFGVAGDRAMFAWRASRLVSLRPGTEPVRLGQNEFQLPDNQAEVLAAASTGWVAVNYVHVSFDLLRAGRRIELGAGNAVALAFSPSGRYLAVATGQGIDRYDLRCIERKDPIGKAIAPTVVVAIAVTDAGEIVSVDATGQLSKTLADDAPPGC